MKYTIQVFITFFIYSFSTEASNIKILTLNVKNDRSLLPLFAIKEELKQKKIRPDIILLQEMHMDNENHSTTKIYSSVLNYKSSTQLRRLEDTESLGILSSYDIMKNPLTGEKSVWSLHLASKSTYTRVALITDFQVKGIGRLRVVNTHLAHKKNKKTANIRRNQVLEIMAWIKHQQEILPAEATLFGGDFNSNKTESFYGGELEAITQKPIMKDMLFKSSNGVEHSSQDKRRIDYIFYASPKGAPLLFKNESLLFKEKFSVSNDLSVKISDHSGVLHEYEIMNLKSRL